MILKRSASKVDTLSTVDNRTSAVKALEKAKSQEKTNNIIKIKVTNGFILVASDKYQRKKRYYHSLFGEENIIL